LWAVLVLAALERLSWELDVAIGIVLLMVVAVKALTKRVNPCGKNAACLSASCFTK
jgi:hypothetical protein